MYGTTATFLLLIVICNQFILMKYSKVTGLWKICFSWILFNPAHVSK